MRLDVDDVILEHGVLYIKPELADQFEDEFRKASKIISRAKGYIGHELQKCVEAENKYLLLIRWETLEDHMEGFRKSADYLEWKALTHHFYDPMPTIEHFENVDLNL